MQTDYDFIEEDHGSNEHPARTFIINERTSYFYNDIFNRSIFLYEKLLDELPELKAYIFKDAYKNLMIVNFFSKQQSWITFPFMNNLYKLSIHL